MDSQARGGVGPEFGAGEIWRLATALAGATSATEVAVAVATCGASAAGASFANLAVLDPDAKRVRAVHAAELDPEVAARWSEFGIDEATPLCEAILTGEPVLLPSEGAIGAAYPHLLSDTLSAGLQATASLPLLGTNDVPIGAIGFGWAQPQAFNYRQRTRLILVAQLAAEGLARALHAPKANLLNVDRIEARVLQEAFLPAKLPHTEHLEVAAAYLPASDAPMGGDWYDAFPVDGGTFLVIGDVAGHGREAVGAMAQLRNAVRAFADEDPAPGRVVTRVNRMLCRLGEGQTATITVARWDPDSRTLVRSNAGHPPLLRCHAGEFSFLSPRSGNIMIGADPGWQYGEETKVLRPGTTLLFYTDGLIESRTENLEDSMERLRLFAEGLSDLAPQAVCDDVLRWRLQRSQREDDICLVAARMA